MKNLSEKTCDRCLIAQEQRMFYANNKFMGLTNLLKSPHEDMDLVNYIKKLKCNDFCIGIIRYDSELVTNICIDIYRKSRKTNYLLKVNDFPRILAVMIARDIQQQHHKGEVGTCDVHKVEIYKALKYLKKDDGLLLEKIIEEAKTRGTYTLGVFNDNADRKLLSLLKKISVRELEVFFKYINLTIFIARPCDVSSDFINNK